MRFVAYILSFVLMIAPAAAERSIGFAAQAPDGADGLVIAVSAPLNLDGAKALLSEEAAARFEAAVGASSFIGALGQTQSYYLGDEVKEIHLIGVKDGEMRARDWADFGGLVGRIAKASSADELAVVAPGANAIGAAAAAEGAILGAYSFDKYKSASAPGADGELTFVVAEPGQARIRFENEGKHRAEAVNWTRDMQSEPANVLYPEEFVRRARTAFRGVNRVSIRVLNEREMERLGMNALLGVGKGSVRPPRLLIINYQGGDSSAAPIVYAGKGITFDTGGISIKSNSGMWKMKADMTGAAAVTAAVWSLAKSNAPVNVIAVAPLAENMPDGKAIRTGDVIRTMSGKTVEIRSTDAEGRLVLSDAMWFAQGEYNPSLLVDVATLTGSVGRALGDEYAGLFAHDDAIADRLIAAGEASGDDVWRLPLHDNHFDQIRSPIADIKNSDTGAPGASTAAAFLASFVQPDQDWAHLDIAGVDWLDPGQAAPTRPAGASGYAVRLLDRLARDLAAE